MVGSFSLFFFLFVLFCKHLPSVSMTEMKETCTMSAETSSWVCSQTTRRRPGPSRNWPAGFGFRRAHGPIPSQQITEVLGLKKSRVGWFTFTGGILGFFAGFSLAIFARPNGT